MPLLKQDCLLMTSNEKQHINDQHCGQYIKRIIIITLFNDLGGTVAAVKDFS